MVTGGTEEGWYLDPFGAHEQRWFSAGHPSKLVRDNGVESYDPPPAGHAPRPLVPVATNERDSGDTLWRADDAERDTTASGSLARADDAERDVPRPDSSEEAIEASSGPLD